MTSLFASLLIVELSLGVSLLFESMRAGSDPSMEDVVSVAKDAAAAGALYKRAAAAMPTEEENAQALFLANAQSIGSVDEEIASELSAGAPVEKGECAECAREYSSLCPKFWGQISAEMCVAPDFYTGRPCAFIRPGSALHSHVQRFSGPWRSLLSDNLFQSNVHWR